MTTLIVGCGYLGRRVASLLIGRGEHVLGTTRDAGKADELARMGVEPVVLDVLGGDTGTPHPNPLPQGERGPDGGSGPSEISPLVKGDEDTPRLPPFERLVYCVGYDRAAGRTMRHVYRDGLRRLLDRLESRPSRFVYTSSTSVYGQDDGSWVTEDDPTEPRTESGRIVLDAEAIARGHGAIIVRLAGLYGPGRIIRRAAIVAGEPIEGNPAKRVNLIHIDDAAAATVAALDRGEPGRAYNVVDDRPVARQELYEITARCLGAPPPRFVPGVRDEADRRMANGRMRDELGVRLIYPDVATGLPAAVEAGRVTPPPAR